MKYESSTVLKPCSKVGCEWYFYPFKESVGKVKVWARTCVNCGKKEILVS